MMNMRRFLLLVATTASLASAFAPRHVAVKTPIAFAKLQSSQSQSSTTALRLSFSPIYTVDHLSVETARTAFFIWFFGASGAAGIARSAFPRMFQDVRRISSLRGIGPTQGGETLGVSPLCGYPEDLSRTDCQQIVDNPTPIDKIVQMYPVPDNYLASKGYLTYTAFCAANGKANPLALRAIFDTLNQSIDTVSPDVAQEKLNAYKENVDLIAGELLVSKMKGYVAIATLLFLLALADWEAFVVHFRGGWFPEWPGLTALPGSLFDTDTGIFAIPKFWLDEY